MTNIPKKDSELASKDEIVERIRTIERNREELESSGCGNGRKTYVGDMHKKHAKICKLTEREEALRSRLREIKKQKKAV